MWLVTPKIKEKVREHFGCRTMLGMPVENEGGSGSQGSHWERRLLGSEIMTASGIQD
jgi:hypothetical protein